MSMISKAQCEALIDRLADKTLSKGQTIMNGRAVYLYHDEDGHHVLEDGELNLYVGEWQPECIDGHPIMLTDVLDKPETVLCWEEEERKDRIYDLWCLWYECGVMKSLQDIFAEAEWEDIGHHTHKMSGYRQCANKPMKGPAAELFEYLLSLFPEIAKEDMPSAESLTCIHGKKIESAQDKCNACQSDNP